jgi:serine/threonine protein phosphatase PrpC
MGTTTIGGWVARFHERRSSGVQLMSRLEWHFAGGTDVGCRRSENQDNFYISPDEHVFVVADGMGGERGGATASRLAVESVEAFWKRKKPPLQDREALQQWLVEAVANANSCVWKASANDPVCFGMGTTIVVSVQNDEGEMFIAHVGDSRAYLVRDGKTIVLTQDHSVVMELLLQGKISAEQIKTSPFRNYITRCVGHNNKVEIDKTPVEIRPDDRVLLCTDGLTAVLSDEEIGEVAQKYSDPQSMVDQLLKATLDGGAPDNVTVVAICYCPVRTEQELKQKQEVN